MKIRLRFLVILGVLLLLAAGCGAGYGTVAGDENGPAVEYVDDDYECEHDELPYEWSGEFYFEPGSYTFEFGESDDPSCAVAFMIVDADMDDIAHMAIYVMEAHMDTVAPGGSFKAEPEYGYILDLNPDGTTFTFEIEEEGEYALFTEHFPHEFDLRVVDSEGNELLPENPVEYEEHHDH